MPTSRSSLSCHTQEEIAEECGIDQDTVSDWTLRKKEELQNSVKYHFQDDFDPPIYNLADLEKVPIWPKYLFQDGKHLVAWLEKLFEVKIPHDTLERRAQRAKDKIGTNVPIHPTPSNDSEIQENRREQDGTFAKGFSGNPEGRPGKYQRVIQEDGGTKRCSDC
jgi:transcriptional regulator with XRE-family HTH domain